MHDEERAAWVSVRRIVTNILGFDDLVQLDWIGTPNRMIYGAYVYAGGVEFARKLAALAQEDASGD